MCAQGHPLVCVEDFWRAIRCRASFQRRSNFNLAKDWGHVKLMRSSKNEDVRQRSANVILDRAYGRPSQVSSDDEDNPLELLMQSLDGKTRGLPSEQL